MNLLEALKSERGIRRKGWPSFTVYTEYDMVALTLEDTLADDWEVEEESINLPYSAWVAFLRQHPSYLDHPMGMHLVVGPYWRALKELAKK